MKANRSTQSERREGLFPATQAAGRILVLASEWSDEVAALPEKE
jgi:hypothetical protein